MPRRFAVLDVFTTSSLEGNPLAVVTDADDLSTEAMQQIAGQFNLSETIFVCRSENERHTAKVRIFTPTHELPFAGHPTVGCAIFLAQARWPGDGEREGIVVLEEGIGPVRAGVRLTGSEAYAEFDAPKLPAAMAVSEDIDLSAAALGLTPREIGFENHKPTRYGFAGGASFDFVPVRDMGVLKRIAVDRRTFDKAFGETGHAYVYCRQTLSVEHAFHARSFAPGAGIDEDPATGSAVAALAGPILQFDQPVAGAYDYIIEQGDIMGRPSRIRLEIDVDGGLHAIRIGGHAVLTAEGMLHV